MRSKLNLIEEILDMALYLFQKGELSGSEYTYIVYSVENDYNRLMAESKGRDVNELIHLLIERKDQP